LHNLIGNGIKYADLSKENSFIQIATQSINSHIILTVSDNGIGIEEQYQPKIFDMYYRGTDRSKGSGLGLFIVREILIKLGGTIEVSSTKGKGTTFKLTFMRG
jgi:signal transduction histidine kinase